MKTVVLVSLTLMAVANCRPDASHLLSGSYLPANDDSSSTKNEIQEERHVYFYASPGDVHYTNYQIQVVPKTRKNTKIIFVKAPHHAGIIPEVIAPQSLAEDKTVVYVLVKKPIGDQSVTIPAGLGVKQVKPEVHFIKYNNKLEAEAAIHNGIQGLPVGVNLPNLENEYVFINALGTKDQGDSKLDDDKIYSSVDTTNTKQDSQHTDISIEAPTSADEPTKTVVITEEENDDESNHGGKEESGPY